MNSMEPVVRGTFARRKFVALAGAGALLPLVAACSPGGATSSSGASGTPTGVLKYWAPLRGVPAFSDDSGKLIAAYHDGGLTASYQVIPGTNLFQTFQSAIAANVGPAVSEGFAFQAFQFADQGAIAMADKLYETMKTNGMYDDYVDGVLPPFKTSKGYVGVPWGMDIRAGWYSKSLLQKAGAEVPTDWPSLVTAGKALAKIGVYGWMTSAGPGSYLGGHSLVSLMINNGGGLFDESGKPDCLFDRNVEAMDFVREMVSAGMVDPGSLSYTDQNVYDSFKSQKAAIGLVNAFLPAIAGVSPDDLVPLSPLTGPHGDKGTLAYLNNFMMYTNTPSQQGSENFLIWWLQQFHGENGFMARGVTGGLPIFKSVIAMPAVQKDAAFAQILKEWQPVAKGYSQRGEVLFAGLASVDGGTAIAQFAQTMYQGKTDSKTALATLEAGIKSVMTK